MRIADVAPALVKPIEFPFPVLDRITIEHGKVRVPFLANRGEVDNFELPTKTLRP